ncbi:TrkH family potassium uptake protein [Diplocloster agilis]|uniref:TrkH family potassium uptake protein n=1 Tax=Diplocloster agilis TaxID=2850323 RepID=A0A949JUW3_9FIRM|nr:MULTISPECIES: TrkH family potassium uptake protein [Lachnospiraceae]MBU9735575.1 TrkH family potassium uptake protein [Diplocloster agilis]MBU9742394.1 TrkH family potassium uptake protein [Diplocloster agilis]MCU6733132.1 TrkH family potassium uptake protein [Suonthocola fibrivorans]SCI76423.1 Trk system potassium uptake protein trkG [uncultured Clostridium sp.]
MNYKMISYILGMVLKIEAVFMTLPCLVAVIYREKSGYAFLVVMLLCLLLGQIMTAKKPSNKIFYTREGFVTVALCWIMMSILGALPFLISGEIKGVIDALFETVSGFTTTGASILSDVESMSRCILFWRSFTHWIGGMGVLVFVLAVLPFGGGNDIHLMRAESPGPSVGKFVPKVRSTAMILYGIYIVITIVEVLFLLAGKMPLFEALCSTFGTAGTGGFGVKNDSFSSYSPYLQYVVTVFMILFGINFNVYFLLLIRKFAQAFKFEEIKYYLGIILVAVLIVTLDIHKLFPDWESSFRHASFQVASIITTTGFSTVDFDLWPQMSKTILVMLMFVGACAGSTGGGIKVSRFVILLKTVKKELNTLIHSRNIKKIQINGRSVEHEVVRSVNVFLIAYVMVFSFSVLLISVDEFNLTSNFTAVAATLNNIGPGLEMVGPSQNFGMFSGFSKLVLIFDMLAGRLELFPLLILFKPATWRKN